MLIKVILLSIAGIALRQAQDDNPQQRRRSDEDLQRKALTVVEKSKKAHASTTYLLGGC